MRMEISCLTWTIRPTTKTMATQETMSAWFCMTNSWLSIGGFLFELFLPFIATILALSFYSSTPEPFEFKYHTREGKTTSCCLSGSHTVRQTQCRTELYIPLLEKLVVVYSSIHNCVKVPRRHRYSSWITVGGPTRRVILFFIILYFVVISISESSVACVGK